MKRKSNQKGFTLVLILILSIIVLTITGVTLHQMSGRTKEIVRKKNMDAALNLAEEGLEHVVNWMNIKNDPLTYTTGVTAINNLAGTDFVNFNGVDIIKDDKLQIASYVTGSSPTPQLYYSVSNSGQFEISGQYINAKSDTKTDFIKIDSVAYIPNKANPKMKREIVAFIQRPKTAAVNLNQAIASDGILDIAGSASTNSGPSPNLGHIHSNKAITVTGGANDIYGNATSTGTISSNLNVEPAGVNSKQENADPVPIPDYNPNPPATTKVHPGSTLQSSDGFGQVINGNYTYDGFNIQTGATIQNETIVLKNCVINGDLEIKANSKLIIEGTVYIKGSFKQTGGIILGQGGVNQLVTEGSMEITGNSQYVSATPTDNKSIFISKAACGATPSIKIKGDAGAGGVYYTSNPDSCVEIGGNSEIFGAVISKGSVKVSGSPVVKRDLNLNNIAAMLNPNSFRMRVASWEEVKPSVQ
jgi:type II secretory pathway pseudopilin PulG